ncbi:hypothetical protein CAEBREN_05440 [Caenorhabditis brenneri]|uniref:F-box associated domain-containing protein n=1 Tax=Caenorhabditis brenneri TaxID=135651 RepID=G0N422_CAEBE|nr:hypothetical protein CAEBREN_05440 [Caenorhabditis brenneri]
MDLLNELFKCSILLVTIRVDNFQNPINFGVTTTNSLQIEGTIPVGTPEIDKILENIQVTSGYLFNVPVLRSFTGDTSKKMFNCRKGLLFENLQSAYWVTRNVFRQLRVPHVHFKNHEFSPKRAVDFVTEWFNSNNRKLKCLYMPSKNPILRRHFQIDHLNPMPFCEKRRSRHAKLWPLANADLSDGFDILRSDGLLATILIKESLFALYVWHKRF